MAPLKAVKLFIEACQCMERDTCNFPLVVDLTTNFLNISEINASLPWQTHNWKCNTLLFEIIWNGDPHGMLKINRIVCMCVCMCVCVYMLE